MSNSTTPASAANERDLKNCPFCGGAARHLPRQTGFYTEKAICDKCDIDLPPAAWNRRAIPQPAAEPVAGEVMKLHQWARTEMCQAATVMTNLADSRRPTIDGEDLALLRDRLASLNRALIETGLFRAPSAVLAQTRTSTDSAADAATCECITCLDASGKTVDFLGTQVPVSGTRMVLCQKCGNKRCPHAKDHRNTCTGSNEPGQLGSAYEDQSPAIAAMQPKGNAA